MIDFKEFKGLYVCHVILRKSLSLITKMTFQLLSYSYLKQHKSYILDMVDVSIVATSKFYRSVILELFLKNPENNQVIIETIKVFVCLPSKSYYYCIDIYVQRIIFCCSPNVHAGKTNEVFYGISEKFSKYHILCWIYQRKFLQCLTLKCLTSTIILFLIYHCLWEESHWSSKGFEAVERWISLPEILNTFFLVPSLNGIETLIPPARW